MQKLVGNKYDPDAAEALASRLRKELHGYSVTVKAKRGEKHDAVTVVFEVERVRERSFDITLAPFLYSTKDGFSGALVPGGETHHNYFSAGVVSSADELLERNSGVMLRYEHRKVGTRMVQVGVEYRLLLAVVRGRDEGRPGAGALGPRHVRHAGGLLALDLVPADPGHQAHLRRQLPDARHGAPGPARRGGARVHVRRAVPAQGGVAPRRSATRSPPTTSCARRRPTLESDFLYTRQFVSADYTLSTRHQDFMFRFQGGHIDGEPPLFDRFTIGNTATLRGWDKFDVAPLGGTRLLYGSLDTRYRPFQLFYDFGKVWDPGQQAVEWKHSVGIGLAWKNGFFMSLGVPLKYHDITPVFMIGFRL